MQLFFKIYEIANPACLWMRIKPEEKWYVFKKPTNKNQLYIFPELLADKVENKPHAARFFSYLAGIIELDMYKKSAMGTSPYERVKLQVH